MASKILQKLVALHVSQLLDSYRVGRELRLLFSNAREDRSDQADDMKIIEPSEAMPGKHGQTFGQNGTTSGNFIESAAVSTIWFLPLIRIVQKKATHCKLFKCDRDYRCIVHK